MTGHSYSPESWERVKREASLFSAKGGCIATLRPDGSAAQLTGTGPTSSTAMHDLARKLDDWKAHSSRSVSQSASEDESVDFRHGYQQGWVDAMKAVEKRDDLVTGLLRYRCLPTTDAGRTQWTAEAQRLLERD